MVAREGELLSEVGRTPELAGLHGEQPDQQRPENGATTQNGHEPVVQAAAVHPDHRNGSDPDSERALKTRVVIAPVLVVEAIWLATLIFILYRLL